MPQPFGEVKRDACVRDRTDEDWMGESYALCWVFVRKVTIPLWLTSSRFFAFFSRRSIVGPSVWYSQVSIKCIESIVVFHTRLTSVKCNFDYTNMYLGYKPVCCSYYFVLFSQKYSFSLKNTISLFSILNSCQHLGKIERPLKAYRIGKRQE